LIPFSFFYSESHDTLIPKTFTSAWYFFSYFLALNAAHIISIHQIEIKTAPADFRFPTTNQTRHCFTRYIEYHRCVNAKGEATADCEKFAKYYRSLCPAEWVSAFAVLNWHHNYILLF
jgi:cytochrome c oxidase subunit 6b